MYTIYDMSIFARQVLICVVAMIIASGSIIADEKPTDQQSVAKLSRFKYSQPHMGVKFNIILYASDASIANKAAKAAFSQIKSLNAIMSDYDPNSELSKLSHSSPTKLPLKVSTPLWHVLKHGQALSVQTDGAFEMTIGPYSLLWRKARKEKKLPSKESLTKAAKSTGYKHLVLHKKTKTVELKKENMRLDLGGIAKGFAADEALRVLAKHGIRSALVDASGDMALGQAPPDKKGWIIAVASPFKTKEPTRYLQLANCGIATSGDLFQHVRIDNKQYSHIINPHTGIGLTNRSSVTVIAPTAIAADSLASAISVLGPSKGIKLANKTCKVEAYIIEATENKRMEYETPGFEKLLIELE